MFDKLKLLKILGYSPDVILDIGAYVGNWTNHMKQIYDNCQYHLFEAIDYPELYKFNNVENVAVHHETILNEKIEEVDWYQQKNTGDSFFKEKTKYFVNCDPIKKTTIDLQTYVKMNNDMLRDAKNILIKIDCQGAEIPILKGMGTEILEKTDFIILEMPLFGQYNEGVPSFLEHIKYMDNIGFIPYDVLENHYVHHFNIQVDILFIKKTHEFNKRVNEMLFV